MRGLLLILLILCYPALALAGPVPFLPGKLSPQQYVPATAPTAKFLPVPKRMAAFQSHMPTPAPHARPVAVEAPPPSPHPQQTSGNAMTPVQARQLLSIFADNR